MEEKIHTYKQKFKHVEVGHSPTYGTSTVHLLPASDQGMVSGFPTTYCCPCYLTMAESVRYVWCFRKAPIMIENLPFLIKGVAKFRNLCGPKFSMRFTRCITPPWSHGLHKHGEIICTIRK